MIVRDIVREYLTAHGYDGLCNIDCECGCGRGDLAPCCAYWGDCEPAYDHGPHEDSEHWYSPTKPESGEEES